MISCLDVAELPGRAPIASAPCGVSTGGADYGKLPGLRFVKPEAAELSKDPQLRATVAPDMRMLTVVKSSQIQYHRRQVPTYAPRLFPTVFRAFDSRGIGMLDQEPLFALMIVSHRGAPNLLP